MDNTVARQTENPLGSKSLGSLLLNFSVPAVISCLVNSIYNIVDQFFIGQGVGYLGNAATTVAFPIMTIIMAFATLIGSGGSAYAAIRLGQKKEEDAQRSLNNVFTLSILLGLCAAVLGLLFLTPILRLFGATDTVLPYAKDYTSIILLGVPFNIIGVSLSTMARTDGHPRLSMYGILIGAVLNTILDPIYIFVFKWGVRGGAIATVTAQILSAAILSWYFWKKGNMRFCVSQMKLSAHTCKKIVTLGMSAGITQLVACIMQVVMNNSLVFYGNQSEVGGDAALSAMGIVMKIAMILAAVGIGIGIGAQPIIGYNYGAQKHHRIRKTYLIGITAATIVIVLGEVICQVAPHMILNLFGGGDAQFISFAVKCLRIYLFGVFCAGFQIISTNYFQATSQPVKASVLSMLRQLLLLIPLLLILPLFFGLDGILFAGPAADICSALIVLGFILPEMRKLNRQIREDQKNKKLALGTAAPLHDSAVSLQRSNPA